MTIKENSTEFCSMKLNTLCSRSRTTETETRKTK